MARRRRFVYDEAPFLDLTPGEALLRRKRDFIMRDPLGTLLTATLRALYSLCEKDSRSQRIAKHWTKALRLRAALEKKYRVHVFFRDPERARRAPPPRTSWSGRPALPWTLTQCVPGLDDEAPMRAWTNWTLPEGSNVIADMPPRQRLCPRIPGPPDGSAPTLTVALDTSRITLHHLDRLAGRFTAMVRHALLGAPDVLLRSRSRRPPLALVPIASAGLRPWGLRPADGRASLVAFALDMRTVSHHRLAQVAAAFKALVRRALRERPAEQRRPPSLRPPATLAFLDTISDATFARYLRRYDLHMEHRLSFRQIAALERMERRGRPAPAAPRPGRVGTPVRGEDAVARSVGLLFAAIHRRPYRRRTRAAKAVPARGGAERFACPAHPARDCHHGCAHLRAWWERVAPTLPSPSTGRLRGETMRP